MDRSCAEYVEALQSSDPDQVNPVIDELGELEVEERGQVITACFEEFTAVYAASSDGYVRQSVVRAMEQLVPRLDLVAWLDEKDREEWLGDTSVTELREQTDMLCGFLVEAVQDKDGRVRNAAKRGLKDVFRCYDGVDDTETIKTLITELDDMADQYTGKREQHILEAKDDAAFFLQSTGARILEGFQKMVDRHQNREG